MASYPQPVIEVIAEIGFATGDGGRLPDDAGAQLYGIIKTRYPICERATDVQLQVEMHDETDEIKARCDRVGHRFLYRTNPPGVVIQLGPQALMLHFVGPYAGWETIRDVIEREWTTTAHALRLRLGDFIALRLVTHLPLAPARQQVGHWIKSNAMMPEAIRRATSDYQSRVEATHPASDMTTSVGIAPVQEPSCDTLGPKPVGLEIAVRQDLTHRVVRKRVGTLVQTLHDHVKTILDATLSPAAERYMGLELSRL